MHELKILPQYFKDVQNGIKPFELRKNDRDFKVGDILILKEYKQGLTDSTGPEKVTVQKQGYTGRKIEKRITYILKGREYGLSKDYVILGLENNVINCGDSECIYNKGLECVRGEIHVHGTMCEDYTEEGEF
ncbi:ASCH/PUA domain-containing protein [Clostridium sp.]|uniref:ASCH/PUA domain-containing protein n=1 Tax=Clostridium sp. TaxID=1506 RepID=UPI0032173147